MEAAYWNDTPDDPSRKLRRMAEFLVLDSVPWTLIESIGVQTKERQEQVLAALRAHKGTCPVHIKPDWYF